MGFEQGLNNTVPAERPKGAETSEKIKRLDRYGKTELIVGELGEPPVGFPKDVELINFYPLSSDEISAGEKSRDRERPSFRFQYELYGKNSIGEYDLKRGGTHRLKIIERTPDIEKSSNQLDIEKSCGWLGDDGRKYLVYFSAAVGGGKLEEKFVVDKDGMGAIVQFIAENTDLAQWVDERFGRSGDEERDQFNRAIRPEAA